MEEVAKAYGISDQTFYNWRQQYSGIGQDELRHLKQLEQENARLKKLWMTDVSLRGVASTQPMLAKMRDEQVLF